MTLLGETVYLAPSVARREPSTNTAQPLGIQNGASSVETRTRITVNDEQLREQRDKTVTALRASNDPPHLFCRGRSLARLRQAGGKTVIEQLSEAGLRGILTNCVDFYKERGTGEHSTTDSVSPPRELVQDILAQPQLPFPSLEGIVEAPILRIDGTILDVPGYDFATGLYYAPHSALLMPPVPSQPGEEDIAKARKLLEEELLGDFPFVEQADRANMLALLLTLLVRPLIDGCVPLALLDKPTPGSGATLLSDVVAIIHTGLPAFKVTIPHNEEEWRKRLTALLIDGTSLIVFDNVDRALESGSLAAVLTTPLWKDRLLGVRHPPQSGWLDEWGRLKGGHPSL